MFLVIKHYIVDWACWVLEVWNWACPGFLYSGHFDFWDLKLMYHLVLDTFSLCPVLV
jgi:hypothetical protein